MGPVFFVTVPVLCQYYAGSLPAKWNIFVHPSIFLLTIPRRNWLSRTANFDSNSELTTSVKFSRISIWQPIPTVDPF